MNKKLGGETKNNKLSPLAEHQFIANCLQIGLKIEDLKEMTYKDVMKIILCTIEDKKQNNNTRNATQADIDKLLM